MRGLSAPSAATLPPLGAVCLTCTLHGAGWQVLSSRLMWMGFAMRLPGAILCRALFGLVRAFFARHDAPGHPRFW